MTAPTARLGRELREVERQMDQHQAEAERLADAGRAAAAAVAYGRALQLAIVLRHVWIGLRGEGCPEAERFRRRRGRYAELEARHRDWPRASGGPPASSGSAPGAGRSSRPTATRPGPTPAPRGA
jgi:hypothetical protein